MRLKRRRSRKKLWAVLVMGLMLVGVTAWYVLSGANSSVPENEDSQSTQIAEAAPKPVSMTNDTLFFGNAYWGRYINDWSMASQLKTAYPFSRLNEFGRQDYNAWIAGLECPTVAGVHLTSAQEDETLSFNCSPDYLPEAAKWFTAFTLANNHTDNQGAEGFAETQQRLDENGIQYFGHYDPTREEDACEVISLPISVEYDNDTTQTRAFPVALCAFHGVFRIPPEETLAVMERYSKFMPVIAMPHMGVEYKATPDELKTQTYRSMVDHGADMVLGDHPHWIQTTEAYKGHLIVYSMGNFIFDQQDTAEVVRSAAIHVRMKAGQVDASVLEDWLAVGEQCRSYHDDCLARIEASNLEKLPMTYEFAVVGTNDSQKIVKPATEVQYESILERLQWERTIKGLVPPYSVLAP